MNLGRVAASEAASAAGKWNETWFQFENAIAPVPCNSRN